MAIKIILILILIFFAIIKIQDSGIIFLLITKYRMFMKNIILALGLLSLSSVAVSAELTKSCEDYFKETDAYVALMEQNDATKAQAETMKAQYAQSKEQFAALPKDVQESTCKQALDSLEQMKKMSAGQ
ncbi:DUF5339 domain-containing protein [Proteus mirabilis]